MAQISATPSLIKAALLKGLRVGIVFVHEDTKAEYHFAKDQRDEPGILNSVLCVMYTSTIGDPLRISGVAKSLKDFMHFVELPHVYSNYSIQYARTTVLLYPGDWYPCFETDKDARIAQVKKMLPELEVLAAEIAEKDKIQAREELLRQEAERKRREEEIRKMEEARRARMSAIPRTRVPTILPNPRVFTNGRIQLSEDDIAEMMAKGAFNSI